MCLFVPCSSLSHLWVGVFSVPGAAVHSWCSWCCSHLMRFSAPPLQDLIARGPKPYDCLKSVPPHLHHCHFEALLIAVSGSRCVRVNFGDCRFMFQMALGVGHPLCQQCFGLGGAGVNDHLAVGLLEGFAAALTTRHALCQIGILEGAATDVALHLSGRRRAA